MVFYAVINNNINTFRVLQFHGEFSLSQFNLERFTPPHILDRRKYYRRLTLFIEN